MASWSGSGSQVVNDVSGRWIRLNWQIDSDDPGFSTTSINWRLRVWLQASYSISDSSNSFTISGSWSRSGAVGISIPSGGGTQLIYDNTNTDSGLGWGSGSSRSFSASISGLYNYGNTASASGSGSVTVPTPSAPSAPGISVSALGNGYVDFGFSAPSYAGDGGVSYYQYSSNNSSWTNYPSNPFRIYGTNGTTVYGYVRAVNAYGQAGPSAGTSGVPRTVPGIVSSFTADNSTVGQLVLNWTAPTDNGGSAVTGYTLKRGATTLLTNANQLTYTDTGLTPASTYLYEISAVNAAGTGSGFNKSFETLGGISRVWNGTSYVTVLPKVWNGTSWVDAQARMWNGTEWKYGI